MNDDMVILDTNRRDPPTYNYNNGLPVVVEKTSESSRKNSYVFSGVKTPGMLNEDLGKLVNGQRSGLRSINGGNLQLELQTVVN